MQHLEKFDILTNAQHGFRKKRSCETQLIKTVHDLASSLNSSEQVDSIILDFSKAFDIVCNRKLLIKIDHYGIRGSTFKWIENFFFNAL